MTTIARSDRALGELAVGAFLGLGAWSRPTVEQAYSGAGLKACATGNFKPLQRAGLRHPAHPATQYALPMEQPRVEGHDGLMWIRGSGVCRDWNGIRYKLGMSGKNVGAKALSMNVAVIPPGGVAAAHIHVGFEVMLYILEGRVRHEYGEELAERVDHEAGDFIFIAPGVPHEVFNLSDTDPVVAVVARSSADEWDSIVPYEKTPQ